VEGKPVAVRLSLDAADRMLQEVMRGFGAMPRRGVEMGGILLGSVQQRPGGGFLVVVEDFEPVACQHSRGATYLLSDEEEARFDETLRRWTRADGRQTYAVGFYRSHTREGLSLAEEDLDNFQSRFPEPSAIALVVKPFATRSSLGAFFIREGDHIRSESSYQEFPFRRKDLGGADAPPPQPPAFAASTQQQQQQSAPPPRQPEQPATRITKHGPDMATFSTTPTMISEELKLGLPTAKVDEKTGKKLRTGWVWIPLSFIFLLMGTVLGFQVALSLRNQLPASIRPDPYSLHLTVTPAGDSLHVRWDRSASPIHSTASGALVINDGGATKVVPLDEGQLQNGSVVYRRASNNVIFRLDVRTHDRVTVSETMEFKEVSAAK
jgi:proteasome lid subunit RPN8/RPN11